jgi:hypothetical protein
VTLRSEFSGEVKRCLFYWNEARYAALFARSPSTRLLPDRPRRARGSGPVVVVLLRGRRSWREFTFASASESLDESMQQSTRHTAGCSPRSDRATSISFDDFATHASARVAIETDSRRRHAYAAFARAFAPETIRKAFETTNALSLAQASTQFRVLRSLHDLAGTLGRSASIGRAETHRLTARTHRASHRLPRRNRTPATRQSIHPLVIHVRRKRARVDRRLHPCLKLVRRFEQRIVRELPVADRDELLRVRAAHEWSCPNRPAARTSPCLHRTEPLDRVQQVEGTFRRFSIARARTALAVLHAS